MNAKEFKFERWECVNDGTKSHDGRDPENPSDRRCPRCVALYAGPDPEPPDVLQMPCVCGASKASEPHDHPLMTDEELDVALAKLHAEVTPEELIQEFLILWGVDQDEGRTANLVAALREMLARNPDWLDNAQRDGPKRPPELSPEERTKRAEGRDRGVLNDGQADG